MRIPKLEPFLQSDHSPLLNFIHRAMSIALDMVSSQPPMLMICPPVTKKDFNPLLHEQRLHYCDENAAEDDALVYHRPILYTNFASPYDQPDVLGWLAHPAASTVKQPCEKHQSRVTLHEVSPKKVNNHTTYIGGDDDEKAHEKSDQ